MLVAGEPGIGKTRLAEEAAERAREKGFLALWGRAWESGGAPAFWPWIQLLRSLIAERDPRQLRDELDGGAPWLVGLVPELADRLPDVTPPRASGSDKARFAVFDAVASFLRAVASSDPLLVVLDDMHAADQPSLLLLDFVSRTIAGCRMLVMAAYQDAAVAGRPEAEKLIGGLARESTALPLRGLAEEEVVRFAELRTPGSSWPPELLHALHETTEGNPFFTTEVVRLVAAEADLSQKRGQSGFPLPDTVRETVRRRFEPLDGRTVELLETAAVIGREFNVATVELASGRQDLVELADEAVRARIVAEVPRSLGRYRFTHNLIRETLYAGLGTARRTELHRAVGDALEARYGESPEHLAELAHHFAEASPRADPARALDFATKAGEHAMRVFAYEQAVELYELALAASELIPLDPALRAELLLALGLAQARADHLAAKDILVAAAAAAREVPDARIFAEAALAIRAFPHGSGVLDEQPSAVLTQALELLDPGDSPLRARVLARLGVALYYWPGTEQRRADLVEEAVAMARRLGDPATLMHVLSNGQLATWAPEYADRDLAWMEELIGLIEETGVHDLELSVRNRHVDLLLELDDVAGARAALRGLELTVLEGSEPRTPAYVKLQRARLAILEGHYSDAERLNTDATSEGVRLHDPVIVGLAVTQLFSLRWDQCRLEELEGVSRRVADRDTTYAWAAALTLMCTELGYEDEARRRFERLAAEDFTNMTSYNGTLIALAVLAHISAHFGDVRRAEALYRLLLPFAGRNATTPQGPFIGPMARYLGILAATRKDWTAAIGHFADARAAATRSNAVPTMMRIAMDEARMLADRDEPQDRERALALLDDAETIGAQLGLERVVERLARRRESLGAERKPAASAGAPSDRTEAASAAALRREGDVWAFDFDRRSVRIRDSKGVRCLALLLANPGVEVHAVELGQPNGGGPSTPAPARAANAELGGPGADDAGPLLDAAAKAAYRQRIEELREDVAEAESFNDPERAASAREELEFLTQELAGAVGLGGRDRKAASSAERARVSVTKAIRSTIRRVADHDPELGRELEATVRTGLFCVYEPDPRRPIAWRVETG